VVKMRRSFPCERKGCATTVSSPLWGWRVPDTAEGKMFRVAPSLKKKGYPPPPNVTQHQTKKYEAAQFLAAGGCSLPLGATSPSLPMRVIPRLGIHPQE
jgi:hypothetical protein